MSSNLNKHCLIGNLGADPEIKSFDNGDKIANLRIATTDRWKDKQSGERREKTEWHSVVVKGGLVGVIEQYARKGTKVYIEGKVCTRKWQDQEGKDRYTTETVVSGAGSHFELLDGNGNRGEAGGDNAGAGAGASQNGDDFPGGGSDGFDDDLPF